MHPQSHHPLSLFSLRCFGCFSRIVSASLLFSIFYFLPTVVFAGDPPSFTVAPVVIDGKGKQREILHFSTTVTNTTKHVVSIYPWVTDIDPTLGSTGNTDLAGTQDKDISESLARWMEVTRGVVDLLPGEHKEIPIMVQVHLSAKPGMYHAVIHLSEGADRIAAEANKTGFMDVAVNIEVLEDINERLELSTFVPEKNFFTGNSAMFNYRIANIGNRGLIPHGKIRIYDGQGEEVATVDANQEGKRLEPSAKEMLGSVWVSGDHFGRYKAMLDLEYGNRGTLQDTVFFWIIPWKKALGMFLTLMIVCVAGAIGMHSYSMARRGGAFAPVVAGGGRVRRLIERFHDDDEEENDEDEDEEVIERPMLHKTPIAELREVEIPRPIHTRLKERTSSAPDSTRLSTRVMSVEPAHQVHLAKREKPKPAPEHIVHLKGR